MDYAQITIYSIHEHFLYISICKKKKINMCPCSIKSTKYANVTILVDFNLPEVIKYWSIHIKTYFYT